MKVGIPKGLLYSTYKNFVETFFLELGAEIVVSADTNKEIFDMGIKHSIDEACLPVKVFHGHIVSIKDKCDIIFIPRIMQLCKDEYICPKFCGLTEMIKNDIPNMPPITSNPIYAWDKVQMEKWAKNTGLLFTKSSKKIKNALTAASKSPAYTPFRKAQETYPIKVALGGHPYNIHDSFVNMNIIEKLNKLGIGVITEANVKEEYINREIKVLYKRPFWTFARNSIGFISYLTKNNLVNGIVYISSFGCGTDSIIIELIKNQVENFPFLLIKIDEQTGEAGLETRIEAFKDILERR